MRIRRVFELAVVLATLSFAPSAFADEAALKQSADPTNPDGELDATRGSEATGFSDVKPDDASSKVDARDADR